MRTAAVITAAGMSSRMQAFKPLLPLGDRCLIDRVIQGFLDAGAEPVIVVSGNQSKQLKEHLSNLFHENQVILVENPDYSSTEMFDSARIGFSELLKLMNSGTLTCDHVFFSPADIPLVQKDTLLMLMQSDQDLVKPVYQGRGGHPVRINCRLLPKLLRYSGAAGLKGAFQMTGCTMHRLETTDPGILMDADTPEDYKALLSWDEAKKGTINESDVLH